MQKRRGYTLIEAMSVIAIIGILASIGSYVTIQLRRQARDAARKNDLYSISQGFEARYLDTTCTDQRDVGFYPGRSTSGTATWAPVSQLTGTTDCNGFDQYLMHLPLDPQTPNYSYYFNLSGGQSPGKHYRLTASLEKNMAGVDSCSHDSSIWVNQYAGQAYDCVDTNAIPGERGYNYYIGR